jgi:hypothetical protein
MLLKAFSAQSTSTTEPSREAYLVFEVERLNAFDGMPWDLAAIPNLPGNVKQGYPFATTLDVLLDATNQPKPQPNAQPYPDISQQGE